MAKNRLFGWMFVEDSNKEPKPTVEPVKQEKFLWYFNNIRHFHGCQFLTM